ncbi:hypothetical protein [Micromonospora sp. CV4]|uniref:hypothetical protein n=1 Tax=Micromonospora sp. CV4 TaxID=2478711 RepID=UPI0011C3AB8C|nr:hypothetical protein [Micromonospora sp. CV4]
MKSLQALIYHVDSGGIQDTALPGTPAAEAIRLLKNGLSVTAFACFEHFIRSRITELLELVSTAKNLPPFQELPEGLQLAATKGAVDALKARLNMRNELMDTATIVSLAQAHAIAIASSRQMPYGFSEWSFGWSSSNIGPGVLQDFLGACGAKHLYGEIGPLLKDVSFDYSAVGLAEGSALKLARIASWRHEAAHDATISIDIELLRTRIVTYLAIALAFDVLASLAVQHLINGFIAPQVGMATRSAVGLKQLLPASVQLELQDMNGSPIQQFYSVDHCRDQFGNLDTPRNSAVVVRDTQGQIADWFFC